MGHKKVSNEPYYPAEIRTAHRCSGCEQLQAELDKHRWIPVEERLPPDRTRVLTVRMKREPLELQRDPAMDPSVAYTANGEWWTNGNMTGKYKPTHWKPIILPGGE